MFGGFLAAVCCPLVLADLFIIVFLKTGFIISQEVIKRRESKETHGRSALSNKENNEDALQDYLK